MATKEWLYSFAFCRDGKEAPGGLLWPVFKSKDAPPPHSSIFHLHLPVMQLPPSVVDDEVLWSVDMVVQRGCMCVVRPEMPHLAAAERVHGCCIAWC